MRDNFFIGFNNKRDRDLGLLVIKRPNFPSLKKKYKEYEIEGRNGVQYEFIGYEDRVLEVQYNFRDRNNINNKIREIRRWLDRVEDNKLFLSDDIQYFYKVKKVYYEDIERQIKTIGKFKVTFTLDSFAYQFSSQNEIELKSSDEIYNDGDFESESIFKIEGNGTGYLQINNKTIKISIGQNLTLDCEKKLCYRTCDKTLENSKMQGDYPKLFLGNNIIKFSGGITKLSIIPNFRYY